MTKAPRTPLRCGGAGLFRGVADRRRPVGFPLGEAHKRRRGESESLAGGQLVGTAEDGELALELARRLNPATRAPEIDELAARRSNTAPADVSPLAYVADSSPNEPEMGDDGYHDGP